MDEKFTEPPAVTHLSRKIETLERRARFLQRVIARHEAVPMPPRPPRLIQLEVAASTFAMLCEVQPSLRTHSVIGDEGERIGIWPCDDVGEDEVRAWYAHGFAETGPVEALLTALRIDPVHVQLAKARASRT